CGPVSTPLRLQAPPCGRRGGLSLSRCGGCVGASAIPELDGLDEVDLRLSVGGERAVLDVADDAVLNPCRSLQPRVADGAIRRPVRPAEAFEALVMVAVGVHVRSLL